jgi:hypothetical protein
MENMLKTINFIDDCKMAGVLIAAFRPVVTGIVKKTMSSMDFRQSLWNDYEMNFGKVPLRS